MNGEHEELKKVFREEMPVLPRPEARQAAIARAALRFSEESSQASQGNAAGVRLMDRLRGYIQRSRPMHSIKLSHALLAGTSLAVIGLAVINVSHLRGPLMDRSKIEVAPQPLGQEENTQAGCSKSPSAMPQRVKPRGVPAAVR